MERREFIKLSALTALPLLLKGCVPGSAESHYGITVHSDMAAGHLAFGKTQFSEGPTFHTKTLVVGGGIAGLSAANSLPDQDFLLCELSDSLGGTSGYGQYKGTPFARGAHYDLAYPAYYGQDSLALFERLGIIRYQPWNQQWGFKDHQYTVPYRVRNQCYQNGEIRKEVMPDGPAKQAFFKAINPYLGKMALPTNVIAPELHHLGRTPFTTFLKESGVPLSPEFVRALDYHMMDDYGGTTAQVSALAGIHYFMCRPYYNEVVELFSPPQGNGYFVDKLSAALPQGQLLTHHMVRRIQAHQDHVVADVVDLQKQETIKVVADRVVYAGQKHALKYIFPQDYPLFQDNIYAPWMVVNIVMDDCHNGFGYWQNEMLVEDQSFMGFIDSNSQSPTPGKTRVLTAYYCLPPDSRKDLRNVTVNKREIAENTLAYVESYFGRAMKGLVKHVFIKAMGHAMPVPVPGYLFDDKNLHDKSPRMAYAGVDNGRLPLLIEAVDSGIKAANSLSL